VVLVLAGCDGNGRLVTPEYYRDKNCPMGIWIKGNEILLLKR
jgi:hypothetical protein